MSDIDWSGFNRHMLSKMNNLSRPVDTKPCVICGFKPALFRHEDLTTNEFTYSVEHNQHRCSAGDIKIKNCETLEEAISKWNKLMKEDCHGKSI